MYEERCATVAGVLDPAGETRRVYAVPAAADFLAGRLGAAAVGAMSERELCPAAFAFEMADIARRAGQKVERKASHMFYCPDCGARNHLMTQVQLRSLDEAPNYACECLECYKRFVK